MSFGAILKYDVPVSPVRIMLISVNISEKRFKPLYSAQIVLCVCWNLSSKRGGSCLLHPGA